MNDKKSLPSRLSKILALLELSDLNNSILKEITEVLTDYEKRIYSLEEDRRRLIADYRSQENRLQNLQKQYSEVLYHLKSLSK